MAAISLDLRARILAARQAGETTAEVADRFDVSPAFVRRLLQRYRESGSLAPKATPRGSKPRLAAQEGPIRDLLRREPDLTATEVRDRLSLAVSAVTVWRAIRRLGLSFKKRPSTPPSGTARTSPPPAPPGPGTPPGRRRPA
jgi:transposase